METTTRAQTVVHAVAPIRICDIGGWTDTWFARHGKVFNIGVSPRVEVEIRSYTIGTGEDRVALDVVDYQDRYSFAPGASPGRHPLLEAVVDGSDLPQDMSIEISIRSGVPAGSSTGTSAAVSVALIGGLDALTPGRFGPFEVAMAAHRIETETLGIESGVQDQICSAFGGVNFIEVSPYPLATVTPLPLSPKTWTELDARLMLVHLGRAHVSTALHEQVINQVTTRMAESERLFEALRGAAEQARDALLAADFRALGEAMRRNTDTQACLHSDLVGARARAVIDIAVAHRALGWKVNGAGGDGGSVTLLCDSDAALRHSLVREVESAGAGVHVIPTALCGSGLRVW